MKLVLSSVVLSERKLSARTGFGDCDLCFRLLTSIQFRECHRPWSHGIVCHVERRRRCLGQVHEQCPVVCSLLFLAHCINIAHLQLLHFNVCPSLVLLFCRGEQVVDGPDEIDAEKSPTALLVLALQYMLHTYRSTIDTA